MKMLSLSSSLLISLILGAAGENRSTLLSQISLKEKQLAEIQKELADLRTQLKSPAASGASYTVKTSDTIHSISRAHGVSPTALMQRNQITDPTKLAIGRILVIPGAAPAASAPQSTAQPAARTKSYVITKGDTFYSIARRHKMTLKELKVLNPEVSTHHIAPGQTLTVAAPVSDALAVAAPKPRKATPPAPPRAQVISTPAPAKPKPIPKPKPISKPAAPAQAEPAQAEPAQAESTPKKKVIAPAPAPPTPPVIKEPEPKKEISSIILTEETTFERFATKHSTTTEILNDLNGWNLPKGTVLARGSEIQLPN